MSFTRRHDCFRNHHISRRLPRKQVPKIRYQYDQAVFGKPSDAYTSKLLPIVHEANFPTEAVAPLGVGKSDIS